MANMQERLEASVSQAEIDVSKLHDIINGNDVATIETENGLVSSIAKHLKDIRLEILQGMETTIETAESNLDKLHQVINGDENTTIETDNGPISSIAKHLKEIRAELTQGVDEIVGTALSAKEIILEAQSDVTLKHESINAIKANIDEIVTNITAINERFVNSIDEFETTLNEAIASINNTRDNGIEAVNNQLNIEKDKLIAELNKETDSEVSRVQNEGQQQIDAATAQAERAKNEADAAYLASQSSGSDDRTDYKYLPDEDDEGEGEDCGMRCANCGNTDEKTLWDEGDTIYCSKCTHRTLIETGEDDVVECPYCHRMRDRKAMYCRWCNDSTWEPSTQDEFEETDKILKEMGY